MVEQHLAKNGIIAKRLLLILVDRLKGHLLNESKRSIKNSGCGSWFNERTKKIVQNLRIRRKLVYDDDDRRLMREGLQIIHSQKTLIEILIFARRL